MPRIRIDSSEVEVAQGATILDAARKLGIDIPTLCFVDGRPAETSCMACVVKVRGRDGLTPSCATVAADGMIVESQTREVLQARRTALELLLGDHVGDCTAPCQAACPAGMDIPLMIRQIAAGDMPGAIATIRQHIALPAVLGRICSRRCERSCRRAVKDAAVSIRVLERYAADVELASPSPHLPHQAPDSAKRVAIVGAGPAGLAAAFHLRVKGHACTLFDDRAQPGGMLRYGTNETDLPRDVLDAETQTVRKLGAEFRTNTCLGRDLTLDDLRRNFDAVLLATGSNGEEDMPRPSIIATDGLDIDSSTLQTTASDVFAAGDVVQQRREVVRAVADGRRAAESIDQFLGGLAVAGLQRRFSTHVGRLMDGEIELFMDEADTSSRIDRAGCPDDSLTEDEAQRESRRCLHCDCRKPNACKLRRYAEACGARSGRYRGPRRRFEQQVQHDEIIYEPGKCIRCGLCVQIAAEEGEELGLSFIGRGFNVRVGVPFDASLADALHKSAAACAAACPTGALVMKDATCPRLR